MLVIDQYPFLRWIFPAYWRYLRNGFALQRFFLKEIESHIKEFNMNNNGEDSDNFIDAYLLAAQSEGQRLDDPDL